MVLAEGLSQGCSQDVGLGLSASEGLAGAGRPASQVADSETDKVVLAIGRPQFPGSGPLHRAAGGSLGHSSCFLLSEWSRQGGGYTDF